MLKEINKQLDEDISELKEEQSELKEEQSELKDKLESVNNRLRNKIEKFIEKIENGEKVYQKYIEWSIQTLNKAVGLYDKETKSEYLDILQSY